MLEEFSRKLRAVLKSHGKDAWELRDYYSSDKYADHTTANLINSISRYPDFDFYDNPAIREVGQAMGYETSRQLHEAVRKHIFDDAIKEEL